MSRIVIGQGFQKKYVVNPGAEADKTAWMALLGPQADF